jgi:hypothetical protein
MSQGFTQPKISGGTLNAGSVVVTAGTITNGTLLQVSRLATGTINLGTFNMPTGTVTTGTIQNLVSGTINSGTVVLDKNSQLIGPIGSINQNAPALAMFTAAYDGAAMQAVRSNNNGELLTHTLDGTITSLTTGSVNVTAGTFVGTSLELTGSATAGTTDIVASTDVSSYRWLSVQLINTWVGTVNIQESNDNNTFINGLSQNSTNAANVMSAINMTANGIYIAPIRTRYVRVRMNAFTSGTAQAIVELHSSPAVMNTFGVAAVQSGAFNVTGTVANGTVNINPVPVPTTLTFGTLGTAGGSLFGTISAASGAGTKHYISGVDVVMQSGSADVRILAGSAIQGTGVIAAGFFSPGGGISKQINPVFATGTNSEIIYHFVGAGTAFITVDYWKGV